MCLNTASSVFNALRASPCACVVSQRNRIVTESYLSLLPSPFVFHIEGSGENGLDVLIGQRFENEHPAPRQQRARQLEARFSVVAR